MLPCLLKAPVLLYNRESLSAQIVIDQCVPQSVKGQEDQMTTLASLTTQALLTDKARFSELLRADENSSIILDGSCQPVIPFELKDSDKRSFKKKHIT